MSQKQADDVRQSVRDSYAMVAEASDADECCDVETSCCGVSADINSVRSTRLGYSEDDLNSIPGSADMGGRVEDWRGNPLGEPLSVSGVSSFVPG